LPEAQGHVGKGERLCSLKNDSEKLERMNTKDKRNTPKTGENIRAGMRKDYVLERKGEEPSG